MKQYITRHRLLSLLVLVLLVLGTIASYSSLSTSVGFKSSFLGTPFGRHFLPAWHSLMKFSNIVHLPYWFRQTTLDTYYIELSINDIEKMNEGLPFDRESLRYVNLVDDDKQYVRVNFSSPADQYDAEVSIRYRGVIQNNWEAEKKALRIKFPKDNLFRGMKGLNLFLPKDRVYFAEVISAYRAKKFGLLTPEFSFVRVNINGRDSGVYLAAEPWSKEFLAKNNVIDTDNIFSNKDQNLESSDSLFSEQRLSDWKSYTAQIEDGPFEELHTLITLIEKANDEEFARIIGDLFDLEKFYRWQIINVLAGSNHQGDGGNSVLLFRKENGMFEFVPWDVHIWQPNPDLYALSNNTITERILSNNDFFDRYNSLLTEYVEDESNFKDDLAFYDHLYRTLRPEFYNDQSKIDSDRLFDKIVEETRDLLVANFEHAKVLTQSGTSRMFLMGDRPVKTSGVIFGGSFVYLPHIGKSIGEFVAENPQFVRRNATTVALREGMHLFFRTVIVPKDLKFIIDPGATLLFAPGVSLVSYSPVSALGTAQSSIVLAALYPHSADPWGSFAVVNTGASKNEFRYVYVREGSNDVINGVELTSQFSLHNAISYIYDSVFEQSKSDDSFHAILGSIHVERSVFKNNSSDGIDVDYVRDSSIRDSIFFNETSAGNVGDAIDLSGSDGIVISGNIIRNYGDKCISVGENSTPIIEDTIVSGCEIGIAVKDASNAIIDRTIIVANNGLGIAIYRKKLEFVRGGHVEIRDSTIWGNGSEITKDEYSSIDIFNSTVQHGYEEGVEIRVEEPDFSRLLPSSLLRLIDDQL